MEATDCTPVWFMRQAGRYMSQYRKIRQKYSLMEMFKTPEIAAEITLQPVEAFSVDAAIIFADILLPLEGMGFKLEFIDYEGPVIGNPIRNLSDLHRVRVADPEEHLGYVLKALELVSSELNGKVPLIGFAGAPFTLACYAIEGGSSPDHLLTKQLMYREPVLWERLMDKFCQTITAFLTAQVRAGARVVQIFDSWIGILSPSDYRQYVFQYHQKIFCALKASEIISIHFGTGTAGLLSQLAQAGGDVIGVDWRISLAEAWNRVGSNFGIQGNLDPVALTAPRSIYESKAAEILEEVAGRPGHIFNLGHGILPSTPEDSVGALADFVHEYSAKLRR